MKAKQVKTISEYIADFPEEVRIKLEKIRSIVKTIAPDSEETISYQMPAFKFQGILLYFAGYNNHIGFYPTSSGITAFQNELSKYKTGRGSIQFPIDKPLPITLIKKIVKFRVKENLEKAKLKKSLSKTQKRL